MATVSPSRRHQKLGKDEVSTPDMCTAEITVMQRHAGEGTGCGLFGGSREKVRVRKSGAHAGQRGIVLSSRSLARRQVVVGRGST